MSFWEILGIKPTEDIRLIKRAYAAKLKRNRPDEAPDAFIALRQTYE